MLASIHVFVNGTIHISLPISLAFSPFSRYFSTLSRTDISRGNDKACNRYEISKA